MGAKKRLKVAAYITRLLTDFPGISPTNCKSHSRATGRYNCAAYAGGDTKRRWELWFHWHSDAVRSEHWTALESQYYHECGYVRCDNGTLEDGIEKIAIYADSRDEWTHAAHQRDDGWWESKLGDDIDILHSTVECLESLLYGVVVQYLKRERPANAKKAQKKQKDTARILSVERIRQGNEETG